MNKLEKLQEAQILILEFCLSNQNKDTKWLQEIVDKIQSYRLENILPLPKDKWIEKEI